MAKNDKVNMPSSGAGLTRYFDEFKSSLQFTPGQVIVFCVLVMVVLISLHMLGGNWLGIQ